MGALIVVWSSQRIVLGSSTCNNVLCPPPVFSRELSILYHFFVLQMQRYSAQHDVLHSFLHILYDCLLMDRAVLESLSLLLKASDGNLPFGQLEEAFLT